ncbi:MAG: hypothetical protein E7628_06390 [Ruminococcaceae bacterium]|nr:hypothetical protein [Oscillospiraceae bacterium]
MEARDELIEKLEMAKVTINEAASLRRKVKEQKESIKYTESIINMYKGDSFYVLGAILKAVKYVLMVIVGMFLLRLLLVFIPFIGQWDLLEKLWYSPIFYIGLVIVATILSLIICIVKDRQAKTNLPKWIEIHESETKELKELNCKLEALAVSENAQMARSIVPPDYFYIEAIDKFIYFLRNGHAVDLREAVRLYDEYVHRNNMEKEAYKAAESAKQAAAAANDIAKNTKDIADRQEHIEFWTIYNASLSEDIKNKMN